MAVPGVANIAVWGEKDPQLQVIVDPDRLRANSITLDTVLQTVRDATAVGAGGLAGRGIAISDIHDSTATASWAPSLSTNVTSTWMARCTSASRTSSAG